MKRIALVMLVLVVLALAAACGSGGEAEPVEVEPTPGEATGLDGATVLAEKCDGVCHSLERVQAEDLDAVGWAAVIDDMIARGADVSDDEAAALAEYLALQYAERQATRGTGAGGHLLVGRSDHDRGMVSVRRDDARGTVALLCRALRHR